MTIMKFDGEPGIYKTCDQSQLEWLTTAGWQLVAMYMTQRALPVPEQQSVQTNGYASTVQTTRAMPTTYVEFVVKQGEQSAIADAHNKLQVVQEAYHKAVRAHDETKNVHTQSVQEIARLAKDVESRDRIIADSRKSKEQLQASHTKMEADIAKIRNAIGELKMKEILAATST